jgi:hypothetical protein
MTPETNVEPLPPLYDRWITELLGGGIPRESQATCDDCAMLGGEARQGSGAESCFFDPVIKCCTWVPTLQNFLVGRILSDTEPDAQFGRASVERRIAQGIGVSPLGLAQPPVFSLLYKNSSDFFGRSRSLSCPHFIEEGGRCGVWRNRNSTCATWFCKHTRGHVGFAFWRDGLHRLLQTVELALARWCLLELQVSAETLRHLAAREDWSQEAGAVTGDVLDNRVDRKAYVRIWGEWLGREHEFFGRCAELVSPLSWADVLALSGPEARAYARLTQEAYSRLVSEEVPSTLKVGSFHLVQIENAITRVSTYSDYDPIDIPQTVMELLRYFDGRPTEQALAVIAEERGVRLDPALVRKMVDFKLLVAPEKLG